MWILILNWEDVLKVHSLACTWAQSCTLRTYSSLACSVFRWTLWRNWNQLAILRVRKSYFLIIGWGVRSSVNTPHPPYPWILKKRYLPYVLQQRLPFLDGNGEVWLEKRNIHVLLMSVLHREKKSFIYCLSSMEYRNMSKLDFCFFL